MIDSIKIFRLCCNGRMALLPARSVSVSVQLTRWSLSLHRVKLTSDQTVGGISIFLPFGSLYELVGDVESGDNYWISD